MKKIFYFVTTLLVSLLWLQEVTAQRIPFQGRLFENGEPITGTVNLVFSITELSWTETHNNVVVSDGLYSVELGATTPVPSTLFFGVDSRLLSVSVNGVALDPIPIYPSLTGNNFVLEIDEAPDGKDAVSFTITGVGTAGKLYRPLVGTSSVSNGLNGGVTGIGISPQGNTNNTYGIFGRATGEGTGQNRGVYGEAISHSTSSSSQYGLVGRAIGEGTGNHFGVFAEVVSPAASSTVQYGASFKAQGNGTGIHYGVFATSTGTHDNFGALTSATGNGTNNVGIRGLASGTGNGETGYGTGSYNTGVQGFARSNSWGNTGVFGYVYNDPVEGGVGVDNIGVVGRSEVNDGAAEMSNIGLKGDAWGSGINKGVVGTAQNGVENWAGWFEGNVKLNNDLYVDGNITGNINDGEVFLGTDTGIGEDFGKLSLYQAGGSSETVRLSGGNGSGYFAGDLTIGGNLNASNISASLINQNYGNFGEKIWEDGLQGYLDLRGDAPEGKDNIRVGLDVQRNDDGETFGNFNLFGPVYDDPNCPTCPRGFVNARVEKRENGQVSGRMDINGTTSPNFRFEGKGWQNSDLPYFSLLGSQQHTDGWFHQHVSIEVNEENGSQAGFINLFGNSGNENIVMGGKTWEGASGANRPFMRMRGQNTNQDLVWIDVRDDGDGGEMGFINFSETSGEFTDINTQIINLNNKVILDTDLNDDGQIHVNSQSGTAIRMYADFDSDNTSHIALDGNGGNHIYLYGQGNINATGTISANVLVSTDGTVQTSDLRLKTNVFELENALEKTNQLRGVSYNWNDPKKSQTRQIGLIAQEVEEVYPELVQTLTDGTKAVNYTQLVAVLIESIKELNKKVESLEEQNKNLQANLQSQDELMKEMALLRSLVLEVMSKESQEVKKLVSNTNEN